MAWRDGPFPSGEWIDLPPEHRTATSLPEGIKVPSGYQFVPYEADDDAEDNPISAGFGETFAALQCRQVGWCVLIPETFEP